MVVKLAGDTMFAKFLINVKAKTQGFNDLLVFGTVTLTALTSGYLHEYYGWQWLNIAVLPFIVLAIIAIVWLHRSRLARPVVAAL